MSITHYPHKPRFFMLLIVAALCSSTALADTPADSSSGVVLDNNSDDSVEPTKLEKITVFSQDEALTRTVGSAHSLEEAALEAWQHDDIHRVLERVPGVYLRGEDGYGLRPNIGMRGANSDRSQKVTLMEDGVLFGPAPYAAPAAYYFPLTARMVGVEVYKGPASIAYGPQTIGGAINFQSAPIPFEHEIHLSVAGGSDGYRRGHIRSGNNWGNVGGSIEVMHLAAEGFKELDGGGDTGFSKTELQTKLGHEFETGYVEFRLGYANEVSDETYLGLTERDFADNPYRRYRGSALDEMKWDWYGARVDLELEIAGTDTLFTAYHHVFERAWKKFNNFRGADIRNVLANPDSPGNRPFYDGLTGATDTDGTPSTDDLLIGTNQREFRSSGLQGMAWLPFETGDWSHEIEVGIRLHSDQIERLHDEFAYEMIDGELQENATPQAITADNTGTATALAVWLVDDIRYGDLTLLPGLRVEHIVTEFDNRLVNADNDNETTIFLPGLGVNYVLNDSWIALGGMHRGFSPASPGLADTDPEDAINYELGLRYLNDNGQLEVVGFFSDYRNLTAICTFSSGCSNAALGQQTNAGEVIIYGLETQLQQEWALTAKIDLAVAANYTFTQTEFQTDFSSNNPQLADVEAGFELPYVPEHRANLSVGLLAEKWEVHTAINYLSAMRDAAGDREIADGEGSDAYTVVDLAASYQLTEKMRLQTRIDNLLGEDYVISRRPFGARPGKPLTWQLGLGISWD